MSETTFGVYAKIAKVMGLVGSVDKDATHHQKWKYQSAEAVLAALRGHMADVGLVIMMQCDKMEDTGGQWLGEYSFTFVDAEDGSKHISQWIQATPHGGGKLDKAMGANHTYAQKYFLMRTFMISSQDDPDADTNDFNGEQAFTPSSNKKQSKKQSKKPIDLDAWNKENMTKFWKRWTGAGLDGDSILSILEIKNLSQWKHSVSAANERIEISSNKAS